MTWAEDINLCTFVSFPAAVKRNEEGGLGLGEVGRGGGRMGGIGGCVWGVGGSEDEGEDRKPMEPSSNLIPLVCSFCGNQKAC